MTLLMPAPLLAAPFVLFPDQIEFLGKIREAMATHRRVLARADTGFGKTVVLSEIARGAMAKGKRVVITAHRNNIVKQISKALDRMGIRHGRIQPGHTMTNDLVQVAMVQTLGNRLHLIEEPDLFIIDECHHAVAGIWLKIVQFWKRCKQLGLSASPIRLDGKGLGDAYDTMVQGPPMKWLMDNGRLCEYDYYRPPVVADLSNLHQRAGDFDISEQAERMNKAVVHGDVEAHYRQYFNGKPALAFCTNLVHAHAVRDFFRDAGWKAECVDGTLDEGVIEDRIAAIGDGRLNLLTSCQLIAEGTDIPNVQGAILLHRTGSLSRFMQWCGRAFRLKPDGSRAIILDHVDNYSLHLFPHLEREWSLDGVKKRPSEAIGTSTCTACYRVFEAGVRDEGDCPKLPGCIWTPEKQEELAESIRLEQVAGELVRVNEEQQRIDAERVEKIRRTPLHDLPLDEMTYEQLDEIRKIKKYHPRWTAHRWGDRKVRVSA